jgi:predicted DNA-binding transcriptional regulator YafY
MQKVSKETRLLDLYSRLCQGKIIHKQAEADRYQVDERSIQRDIDDIRAFLGEMPEQNGNKRIVYDRLQKGFRLDGATPDFLTNNEILAIAKILLESRAFRKDQIKKIINKLITNCIPKQSQKTVNDLVSNEVYHYVELHHKVDVLGRMWDIGQAIHTCHYMEIEYGRLKNHQVVKRKIKPVAIMFSEFYFYLAAYIEDEELREKLNRITDTYPTIYRIDRIQKMKILDEQFHIPYKDRFEEGEFRKRVQFMFGGPLRRVRFRYSGISVEAVLDRLPTARIVSEDHGVYTITAEAYGHGIDMWLKSQGDAVEVLD